MKDGKLGAEPSTIGTTRFGGRPDLPAPFDWPTDGQRPLAFLGQVNLAAVRPYEGDKVLPSHGLLVFFYDVEQQPWGLRTSDGKHFAVHRFEDFAPLRRREFPRELAEESRVRHCRRVRSYTRWMLGLNDGLVRERLGLPQQSSADDPWQQALESLEQSLTRRATASGTHQLLGWADGLYDRPDSRFICAAASAGIDPGEHISGKKARLRMLEKDARNWRCLLQVHSDDALYGSTWGDGGTLAFMIRSQDMRAGRWDRAWCILGSS